MDMEYATAGDDGDLKAKALNVTEGN